MSRSSKARRETGASRREPLDWTGVCCGQAVDRYADDDDEQGQRPCCHGPEGTFDPDRLARAHALDGEMSEEFPDGTSWAFECVFSMLFDYPEQALEIIRRASEACETDWQRTKLGCGNLESLLGNHGRKIIGEVERIAREQPAFRECLSNVWQHGMPDDIWERVLVASGRSATLE
jgi:hypothetical protein